MTERGKKKWVCISFLVMLLLFGISIWIGLADTSSQAASETKKVSLQWSKKKTTVKAGSKTGFQVSQKESITLVRWSVSNKNIGTISNQGIFLAKRAGIVTIKASVGNETLRCRVKVKGKKKIAIDAGHQARGNSGLEPIGPGASVKKAKVAGGATGVATRVPEYKLTLSIAKKLRKELLNRGYEVYMIRTKNFVNISNKKRAILANQSGSHIYIRLHGDSSGSSRVKGASGLYPSASNPYVGALSKSSKRLTKCLLTSYCKKTGIRNRGLVVRNDLTGTNWSKIPVTLIEMGFMSNPSEDRNMQKTAFQKKMIKGLANGIDSYFGY